jgi:hypothetical protein
MTKERIICWFSCGAASAVATKRTIELYSATHEVLPCYCNTLASEHPDNSRFIRDCERWFGRPIKVLTNEAYADVDDVFMKTRYMSGVRGARCTTELKKLPRLRFALPDDIHVFGLTANETKRINDFEMLNPELKLLWVLRDLGLTKSHCYPIIVEEAQIELPAMYKLGFHNNNCPGCVKASSPWYWDMVRRHFPIVFERRCKQSRELGVRLVEIRHHVRIFLDELPAGPFRAPKKENLSCGPECGGPAKTR